MADDVLRDALAGLSYYADRELPPELAGLRLEQPADRGYAGLLERLDAVDGAGELLSYGRSLRETGHQARIHQVIPGDPGWPAGTGADRLPCLWVRGRTDLSTLLARAVTVTGSSLSTPEGRAAATDMARVLTDAGWNVVTGLSMGIDAAAADTAFAAASTGPVLVFEAGLDHRHHLGIARLAAAAAERGALISAYPPGYEPDDATWTAQRWLLGSLTAGTVLIEVPTPSRSLLTAHAAEATGRRVWAVPGSVVTGTWGGCYELITAGAARMVTHAAAILDDL
jgi:DNA processing protein